MNYQDVLEQFKLVLPDAVYNNYLHDSLLLEVSAGAARIQVTTPTAAAWLSSRMLPTLAPIFSAFLPVGEPVILTFEVKQEV